MAIPDTGGPVETAPPADDGYRVTTVELFFDLVFVFTITQLTGVLAHELSPVGLLRVVALFGVLWWIYSGYAWLTNTVAPTTTLRRLLLLVGMAGFLIMALATPRAFDGGGVAWGLGYLVVVLVHGGLYAQVNRQILRVLPVNLAAAALVIGAGLTSGPATYALWIAAVLVPIAAPYVIRPGGRFSLRAPHIVERHGLLVLITLGESVVAIGIGLSENPLDTRTAVAAVLGLALAAALWWPYFAEDDLRAESALARMDDARRTGAIMNAYFYAHIPLMIGIVAAAAGVKKAMAHPVEALHTGPAVALGAGVAAYLLGDAAFRRILRIGSPAIRVGAAGLSLAAIPVGAVLAGEAELIALVLIIVAALLTERRSTGGPG
ncbi:low temperature requirement protein A [Actinoallomurus rhizosphaericola]|uniref:low temperature requirement protein A n=1 Tax=Actinoallomurus rhizosphaericola TaxID=2952536 RepID=UPI0020935920|nr:low temperature requirement protein A [Actinoallomurus rhizosphaericola]MCO5997417.1 low temperature requirement protein A [Actinoallomurus rhizosphaericola]